ncbi:CLIP domain-containing serine protease B9-like, partial [Frankliniella occidentalis]|uniref:CLIP domain-containing serine protease B9-like n=1 Tax=Frankliniella occidentalis TaxID=133901 RepID=A0A9C6XV62_FRAOC
NLIVFLSVADVKPLVDEHSIDLQTLGSSLASSAEPLLSSSPTSWSTSVSGEVPAALATTSSDSALWSDRPDDAEGSPSSVPGPGLMSTLLAAGPTPSADPDELSDGELAPSKVPRSVAYTLGPTEAAYSRSSVGNEVLCAPGAYCAPLFQCRTILDLLDKTCLSGEKLAQLTCGTRGAESMVCCPPGGFSPIYLSTAAPVAAAVVTAPPVAVTTPDPLPAKCGVPHLYNWRSRYAGVGAQPWVARVGFKKVDTGAVEYPCCGSIISERVILTAAHCALAKSATHKLSSVRVGEYDANSDPDCSTGFCSRPPQDIPVDHVVVHPSYERATFRHDVALLVLKAPVAFHLGAQPICINQNVAGVVGQRAKLVGWGLTAGQTAVPGPQQQLDLPIVQLETCAQVYERVVPVTSDQLCVGGEQGRDACSGFGGAPLVSLDATGTRYYQIGIVSFGSTRCGVEGVPSVYTRVDHYAEWIRANMVQ